VVPRAPLKRARRPASEASRYRADPLTYLLPRLRPRERTRLDAAPSFFAYEVPLRGTGFDAPPRYMEKFAPNRQPDAASTPLFFA